MALGGFPFIWLAAAIPRAWWPVDRNHAVLGEAIDRMSQGIVADIPGVRQ